MKKQLIALWMVILILPSCVSVAHANEGYALAKAKQSDYHIKFSMQF